jgi:hypothetical protein
MVAERLRRRRPEIEQAILTRVYAVADPTDTAAPEYVEGVRSALAAALEYALAAVELGEERSPPVPPVLQTQARLAARTGVSIDTVLRRYFSGFTLFGDFVLREAGAEVSLKGVTLHRLLQDQAAQFDRLVVTVTDAFMREAAGRLESMEDRRAERVERLLGGELIDASELKYDFGAHHLGIVAIGPEVAATIRELAKQLDRGLLLVRRGEEMAWAWLCARRRIDPEGVRLAISATRPTRASYAIGEPAHDVAGWRLTHRQARAAMPIAMRNRPATVRYVDVALLASTLQDDLLATSLREIYLAPLARERDGGATLRETLSAYFAAERNVTAAAAALKVDRHTVASRLRAVEQRLGRPLGSCAADFEITLRLEGLTRPSPTDALSNYG